MAEIELYGVVTDDWVRGLRDQMRDVPEHEPIELRVSSPGGGLGAGVAAYNLLTRAKNEVIAWMDGDAFSAATLITSAADHVEMPSNTLMMIHDPWVPAISPATIDEVEKTYRYLKATRQQAVDIYAHRTGKPADRLGEMMAAETYLTAREALNLGLATNVTGPTGEALNMAHHRDLVRDPDKLAQALANRPRNIRQLVSKHGISLK